MCTKRSTYHKRSLVAILDELEWAAPRKVTPEVEQSVLARADKTVLDAGSFQLSATPHPPGTISGGEPFPSAILMSRGTPFASAAEVERRLFELGTGVDIESLVGET
jgi:hypothetical protein